MKKVPHNINLLPKAILRMPNPIDILDFHNFENEIEYLDDERLALKKNEESILFIMLLFAGIIFGIPFLVSLFCNISWLSIISGILLLVSILFILVSEYADSTNKYPYECEFNRKNGTVTYSKVIRFSPKRETRTFPFTDCDFEVSTAWTRGVTSRSLYVKKISNKEFFITSFRCIKKEATDETMQEIFEIHSFLQWYMDRNRPLPPGNFFDQYRQRDYERRKSQGFDKPLTPSIISMSEYNGTPYEEDDEKNRLLYKELSS